MFLLQAWDSYAKSHSVENDRPGVCVCDSLCCILNHFWLSDLFPADQLYVVMATENAGISLENYQVNGHLSGFSYICTLTHTHLLSVLQGGGGSECPVSSCWSSRCGRGSKCVITS